MMSSSEKELKRTYLDYLIAAEQTPLHLKHIMVAMRNYGISFFPIVQNSPRFDIHQLKYTRGFVALIGDDTTCSMGPDHFDRAERVVMRQLLNKCSHVAIISSAVVPRLYDCMARLAGQVPTGALIIETRPEHEVQWVERIYRLSPDMPLMVSTPNPDKMAEYAWSCVQSDSATPPVYP